MINLLCKYNCISEPKNALTNVTKNFPLHIDKWTHGHKHIDTQLAKHIVASPKKRSLQNLYNLKYPSMNTLTATRTLMNTFHNTLEAVKIMKSICIIKGDESKGNLQYPLVPSQSVGWKGGRMGVGGCCIHLHPHSRELFWSCEQGGFFKAGIWRKWTFVPQQVTHNIYGIILGLVWLRK